MSCVVPDTYLTGTQYRGSVCNAANLVDTFVNSGEVFGACVDVSASFVGVAHSYIVTACNAGSTSYTLYGTSQCTGASVSTIAVKDVCSSATIPGTSVTLSLKMRCGITLAYLTGTEYQGRSCQANNMVNAFTNAAVTLGACNTVATSTWGVPNSYIVNDCKDGATTFISFGSSDCTGPSVTTVARKNVCADITIPGTTVTLSLSGSCSCQPSAPSRKLRRASRSPVRSLPKKASPAGRPSPKRANSPKRTNDKKH